MRCVVHIGTHKTGTSSIQLSCARNRSVLLRHGVYYLLGRHSPKNLNFIGQCLARGAVAEPRELLAKGVKTAQQHGADTLLFSAESLYAISTFFGLVFGRDIGDYWSREHELVSTFRRLLPVDDVKVLCYVRRQDRFVESIYNQMVKNPWGFSGSIADFLPVAENMLDYARHLEVWGDVFGTKNVQAHVYETHADKLVERFVEHAVGVTDVGSFEPLLERVNERLGRDVLEYKRVLNRLDFPLYEAFVEMNVLWRISAEMGDARRYSDFLSPSERVRLYRRYEASNGRLVAEFVPNGEERFDSSFPPDDSAWSSYPGLSAERSLEIMLRHQRYKQSARVRLELFVRRLMAPFLRRLPVLSAMLWPIRRLIYRR